MRVFFASAEVAPLSKVGGLADVAGSLPKALVQKGHDVRIITPRHDEGVPAGFRQVRTLDLASAGYRGKATIWEGLLSGNVITYLVEEDTLFGPGRNIYGREDDLVRYLFFSKAVLETCKAVGWQPDVIHCNDWHTAAIPFGLRNKAWGDPYYRPTSSVMTIHNLRYRGPDELSDQLMQGIFYADVVSTVSKTYAKEILTEEYGEGLKDLLKLREPDLYGIINGLDYDEFNPATDHALAANYSASDLDKRTSNKIALQARMNLPHNPDVPLIAMVSRLTEQKGLDLMEQVLERKLRDSNFQLAILGTGEERYHEFVQRLSGSYSEQVSVSLAFNADLAQLIYGGSDIFLMPSRYEPCGLGQLISMRYGSVPLVRATGGLADTVIDSSDDLTTGTGFVFKEYTGEALSGTIDRALKAYSNRDGWRNLMSRGMAMDFSWGASAAQYESLYQTARKKRT